MSFNNRFHKVDSAGECDPDCRTCREMWAQAKAEGAAEEREALAKWFEESDEAERVIADRYSDVMSPSACGVVCLAYADAIRARGEKKPDPLNSYKGSADCGHARLFLTKLGCTICLMEKKP